MKMKAFITALAVPVVVLAGGAVKAQTPDKAWLPTWYASPSPSSDATAWIKDLTIREIVHTTAGGKALRIRLSNAYGTVPLHIDQAFVANRLGGANVSDSVRLRFAGTDDVTIAPGATVVSDPVEFAVKPESDLGISLYLADAVASTGHLQQRSAIYFARGNVAADPAITPGEGPKNTWSSWLFLSEVEVSGSHDTGAIVAFGDSITDGMAIDSDSATSWPDRLYDRLVKDHRPFSVINAGITGNRLTRPGQWGPFGDKGLDRFDRDVLALPNVAATIILIGINDIGQSARGHYDYVSAEDIEAGLAQLTARAHTRGLKVYLATLVPFRGAKDDYYTDDKDALRQAVNAWIRTNAEIDGFVDFDKALDDPANTGQMKLEYDSGDHLHPNSKGAKAMADAVSLDRFNAGMVP